MRLMECCCSDRCLASQPMNAQECRRNGLISIEFKAKKPKWNRSERRQEQSQMMKEWRNAQEGIVEFQQTAGRITNNGDHLRNAAPSFI